MGSLSLHVCEFHRMVGTPSVRKAFGGMPASVLIVEDEARVLVLVQSMLVGAGYETLTASRPSEAFAILRSHAHIDVLLTGIDLRSTRDAGLTLARKAVRLRPSLAIVYASARPITDEMRSMFVEGARCLPKPYRTAQVLAAVEAPKTGCGRAGTRFARWPH
jgi:CheY-like chemotaxis protein